MSDSEGPKGGPVWPSSDNPDEWTEDQVRWLLDQTQRRMPEMYRFFKLIATGVATELENHQGLDPEVAARVRELRETDPLEIEKAKDAVALMRSWDATEGESVETLPKWPSEEE